MTTAMEVQTGSQLLYLAIDLGASPPYERFSKQVRLIEILQRYCIDLRKLGDAAKERNPSPEAIYIDPQNPTPEETYREAQRKVETYLEAVRIEYPDPVIAVVRTSLASPWVTVLQDIATKSAPAAYGVGGLIALQQLMRMVMEWQNHRQSIKERRAESSARPAVEVMLEHQRTVLGAAPASINLNQASEAIQQIEPVLAAEMIDPGDPRVSAGN